MRTKSALVFMATLLFTALLFTPAAAAQGLGKDPHAVAAIELRAQALAAYGAGDYDTAALLARRAKAELALVQGTPVKAALPPLPATYTVKLTPDDRDCLSKIAGYPFVYGDREKWPVLYRANKETLKHPENADLIFPEEVLVIPSIAGETREGEWSPTAQYPVFGTQVR